jgi:hypothetical protein
LSTVRTCSAPSVVTVRSDSRRGDGNQRCICRVNSVSCLDVRCLRKLCGAGAARDAWFRRPPARSARRRTCGHRAWRGRPPVPPDGRCRAVRGRPCRGEIIVTRHLPR